MPRIHVTSAIRALILMAASAVSIGTATAQSNQPPERFTAFAVSLDAGVAGASVVEIDVKRWSSQAEQEQLAQTLLKSGPEELLETLRDMQPVGTIRTPDSLGYDSALCVGAGRRGWAAHRRRDRSPISFWEAVNRPRSIDYPFTGDRNPHAEGRAREGKASIATRITAVGKSISLERLRDDAGATE